MVSAVTLLLALLSDKSEQKEKRKEKTGQTAKNDEENYPSDWQGSLIVACPTILAVSTIGPVSHSL